MFKFVVCVSGVGGGGGGGGVGCSDRKVHPSGSLFASRCQRVIFSCGPIGPVKQIFKHKIAISINVFWVLKRTVSLRQFF